MNNYQASGPGTLFLARPALQFLLTTDPFLGTATPGVPDGPFNRELYKLLENDSALANLFVGYLSRTFGADAVPAPAVNTIPDPLAGAPSTPANLAMHTVYYSDAEVVYRYDGTNGMWLEETRMTRVYSALVRNYKKVEVTLTTGVTAIAVPLPTTNSLGAAFGFTLDDMKTYYVQNLDAGAPVVSVGAALRLNGSTLQFVASSAPVDGADYKMVVVFENIAGY